MTETGFGKQSSIWKLSRRGGLTQLALRLDGLKLNKLEISGKIASSDQFGLSRQ
jgi:hypothetical protein